MKINKKNAIAISLFLLLFLLNIGYAAMQSTISVSGSVSSTKLNELFISEFYSTDSNGVTMTELPEYSSLTTNASTTFSSSEVSFITYSVTISNGTDSVQKYTGETFNVSDTTKNIISYEVTNLTTGTYLLPGESVTFEVTYRYINSAVSGDYDLNMTFNFDDSGKVAADLITESVDLTNVERKPITIKVANSGDTDVSYQLTTDSTKFDLTDSTGNALSNLTIKANSQEEVTVYVSKKTNINYYKTKYDMKIYLQHDTTSFTFDKLAVTTNVTTGYEEDNEPPLIGPVSLDINNTNGTFDVTWTSNDAQTASPVTDYVILLYDSSGNLIEEAHTNSSDTTYRFTNKSEGSYYAIVYGIDEAENTGESYATSATTESTYARKSATTAMKWTFTITFSLSNLTHDSQSSTTDTANLGESYSTTLAASGQWYTLPDSVTIAMAGNTLSSGTDYTYSSSSGVIKINEIKGDVTITASAKSSGCLAKGTKITLATGKTKNIEDITYDDLLLVWNHETGSYTYEYPIWIEKRKINPNYKKISFSDGTILNVVTNHGLFSKNLNQFVSVLDNNNFKIGTEVAKLDENNNITYVTVTNIENINEKVEYYFIASTRYYNIIANGLLTTDGNVMLSNLYEFGNNINWQNRDYENIDLYDYSLFSDIMPYYMFKGLRVEEGKVLSRYLDLNTFRTYLLEIQLNEEMILKPNENSVGKRIWMVTTSDDEVINKEKYLYEEGTSYKLKEPKNKTNFIAWYNTSDGNMYQPGDEVIIYHGTHFEAIYKK